MIYSKLYTKLPPKICFKTMCKEALNCWVQTSENWVKRSSTTLVYYSSYISERKERNLVTNKKKTFKTSFLVLVVFLAVCVRDFDACLFPKILGCRVSCLEFVKLPIYFKNISKKRFPFLKRY